MNIYKKTKTLFLFFSLFLLLGIGTNQRSYAVTSEGAIEFTGGVLPNTKITEKTPPPSQAKTPSTLPSTNERIIQGLSIFGLGLVGISLFIFWRKKKSKEERVEVCGSEGSKEEKDEE